MHRTERPNGNLTATRIPTSDHLPMMNKSLEDIRATGKRYATIFADPPWPEQGGGKSTQGAATARS
ncbi:MAG TPA: hypothetical protein VMK12_24635 [Anaeromyxobacteraceae bacterium]|nr:hypothetical protein [Anaeromyxobacteraceae bacterium]